MKNKIEKIGNKKDIEERLWNKKNVVLKEYWNRKNMEWKEYGI